MPNVLLSPTDVDTEIAKRLQTNGARILAWPELHTGPLESCGPLDEAIENLFGYDWLILKNCAAAEFFLQRFRDLDRDIDTLDDLRVGIVGESAAQTIRESQVHVDLPLDRFPVEGIFPAIASYLGGNDFVSGLNVLVPCANISREVFEEQLESQGARVDTVATYRTTAESQRLAQIKGLLLGGGIDCVLFTQPSAIEDMAALCDTDNVLGLLGGTSVCCLDQLTNDRATRFGMTAVRPNEPSVDELAKFLIGLGV